MIGAETNLIVTVSDLKSDFKSDFKSERAPRTPLNHSFDAVYEKTLSRGDTGDESREIRFGSGNAERVRAGKSGSEGKNGAGRKSGIERKNGFERGAVQEDEPENGDGELLEEDKTGVSARYEWLAPLMMAAVHSEAPAVTPEASAAPVLETGLTLGFAGLEPDGAVFPEMGLAPEGLTVSGTGLAPEAVFASEAGLASGMGLVPGPGFDPEAAFVPGTVFAPETGLAAGTAVPSETGLDAGTVFVPEAGLAAETVFAPETVIFPETAIAPETAIFTEAVSVTDGPVLPEMADAPAAASLEAARAEAARAEAARMEAPAGENALPEEDAGLAMSAGSSGLTGETGGTRGGMAEVLPIAGPETEVSVFSGQTASEPTSSEPTSSGQISAEPASSGQVPLESVLGATSPEQSGAAPLAVKPGTAAETEGSEAAEFTQGAYDGSPGVLAESPVNPQGQGQQEQGGSGSAFRRQTSQTSEQQSTLAQMLNQPVQRFFVNQPVNGSSPGAFAADMPEIVLQSFRSFENADGAQEMVIQLTPEALGRLTVKLVSQDGLLAIRILAQSPMTQRVLESGIASLKQALDQQGIRYQRIEVELDGRQMGHHQSGEEQASAWGSRQNQWAYDQQRFQGPRFYDAVEERMALAGEIPGEIPGAAAQQEEDAYEGKINYVV